MLFGIVILASDKDDMWGTNLEIPPFFLKFLISGHLLANFSEKLLHLLT